MKTMHYLKLWMLIVLVTAFVSCNSENEQEDVIFELLSRTDIKTDTIPQAQTTWVYGFKIRPAKAGTIEQVGIKLPATGSYQVKLWNLDKGQLLAEKTISSQAAHKVVYAALENIAVEANVTLGVAVKANTFYKISRKDGAPFIFPIVDGNLKVLSYHETQLSANPNADFPDIESKTQMAPCVDIVFIADK
jgi:hypothetical protein